MVKTRCRWLILSIFFLFGITVHIQTAFARDESKVQFELSKCLQEASYWHLVEQTRFAVSASSESLSADQRSALITDYANQWQILSSVCMETGGALAVEGVFVSNLLSEINSNSQSPSDLINLVAWLDKLAETRQLQLSEINPQAQPKLSEILAMPEFNWPPENKNILYEWINSLILRFLNWLDNLLGGRSVAVNGPIGLLLQLGLPFIAILLLGLLIIYIINNLKRSFAPSKAMNSILQAGDEMLGTAEAFRLANSMANQGDFRNGIRYLFLSSLLALDERGLLRFDKTRTNREYLATLRSTRGLLTSEHTSQIIVQTFVDLVEGFEQVWYGYQPIGLPGFQNFANRVSELKRAVGFNKPSQIEDRSTTSTDKATK